MDRIRRLRDRIMWMQKKRDQLLNELSDVKNAYRMAKKELRQTKNENQRMRGQIEKNVSVDNIEELLVDSVESILGQSYEYEGHPVFIVDLDYHIEYSNTFAEENLDFKTSFRDLVSNKTKLPNLKKPKTQSELSQDPLRKLVYNDGRSIDTLFVPLEIQNRTYGYSIKLYEPGAYNTDQGDS